MPPAGSIPLAFGQLLALGFALLGQQLVTHGLDDRRRLRLHVLVERPQSLQNGFKRSRRSQAVSCACLAFWAISRAPAAAINAGSYPLRTALVRRSATASGVSTSFVKNPLRSTLG